MVIFFKKSVTYYLHSTFVKNCLKIFLKASVLWIPGILYAKYCCIWTSQNEGDSLRVGVERFPKEGILGRKNKFHSTPKKLLKCWLILDILEGADEMTDGWIFLWLIQEYTHLAHILPTLTGRSPWSSSTPKKRGQRSKAWVRDQVAGVWTDNRSVQLCHLPAEDLGQNT